MPNIEVEYKNRTQPCVGLERTFEASVSGGGGCFPWAQVRWCWGCRSRPSKHGSFWPIYVFSTQGVWCDVVLDMIIVAILSLSLVKLWVFHVFSMLVLNLCGFWLIVYLILFFVRRLPGAQSGFPKKTAKKLLVRRGWRGALGLGGREKIPKPLALERSKKCGWPEVSLICWSFYVVFNQL